MGLAEVEALVGVLPHPCPGLCVEVLLQVLQLLQGPVLPDCHHPVWHPYGHLLGLLLCLCCLLPHRRSHLPSAPWRSTVPSTSARPPSAWVHVVLHALNLVETSAIISRNNISISTGKFIDRILPFTFHLNRINGLLSSSLTTVEFYKVGD